MKEIFNDREFQQVMKELFNDDRNFQQVMKEIFNDREFQQVMKKFLMTTVTSSR